MLNMPLCLTWLDYDANQANAGLIRDWRIFDRKICNSELCGSGKYGRNDWIIRCWSCGSNGTNAYIWKEIEKEENESIEKGFVYKFILFSFNLSFHCRKQPINPMKVMMVQYSISVGINSFDKFSRPVLLIPLSLSGISVKWKWPYISINYMRNRSVSVEMICITVLCSFQLDSINLLASNWSPESSLWFSWSNCLFSRLSWCE